MKKVFILLCIVSWSLHITGGDAYHSRHRTPVFLSSRQTMWESGARLLAFGEQSEGRTDSALPVSEKPSAQLVSYKPSEIGQTVVRRDRSESDSDSKQVDRVTVALESDAVKEKEIVHLATDTRDRAKSDMEIKREGVETKKSIQDLLAHVIKDHTRACKSGLREKRRRSMSVLPDKNRDDFINRIKDDQRTSQKTKDILETEIQRYAHRIPTDKKEFEAWKMQNGLYLSEATTDVSKLLLNGDYHAG